MKNPTRILIDVDGSYKEFQWPLTIKEIESYLKADALDFVTLTDRIHVMAVDDTGAIRNLPVNPLATALYMMKCGGQNTWRIHGPVIIVPDNDFARPGLDSDFHESREYPNAGEEQSPKSPDAGGSGGQE